MKKTDNTQRPKCILITLPILCSGILMWAQTAQAQHFHLNAGAPGQAQDTPLFFQNGRNFATNSAFAVPLTLATNGTYNGYYELGGFTCTAIGSLFTDPAAPGTQVRLRFVSVDGPPGGSFAVWDVDGFNVDELASTNIAFSLPVGTANGTNSILLSENNGEPGADPFGHIHGRHMSATVPGLYVVGLQLYDSSTNGIGGRPLHAPSEIHPIYFQAGVTIRLLVQEASQTSLTFATRTGSSYYVETSSWPSSKGVWSTLAGPIPGDYHLWSVEDTNTLSGARFYRLRMTTP